MTVDAALSPDPQNGYRFSRRTLRAGGEGRNSPLYRFLERFAIRDMVYSFDDFDQDTINLDRYAVANGGGASAASFAITVAEDGWIRATTGTANDDTASASLIGPAIYYGDRHCGMEVRFKPVTAITETRIEIGFLDVVPGSNKPAVNSLTTPSVNTSVVDAALYVYNHTGSTTTNELVTIGSSITAAKATFTPPTAIAAGTIYTVRIQVVDNRAFLWMDGKLVASLNTGATDYIEGGSAICPWFYIKALNATSKSLDVDYLALWKDRAN